jgi:SAM-dependent methyltransferase
MVEEAEERNEELFSSGRLDVQQGNSDDIPYEDNTFDHVFCINVVYFWDAPAKHFREIYRVLKPGGKFYAGIRPKEVMQQMPFTQYGFNMYSPEELKALFEKHGFSSVNTHTRFEPEFELNGQVIQLQSACVWGKKPL